MKNFVANGESLQIVAPVGGVVGGQLYKQGGIIGVVVASAAEGESFTSKIKGAYSGLPKTAAEAWAVGDPLYFIHATSALSKVAGAAGTSTFAGYAYDAAQAADVVGSILLSH